MDSVPAINKNAFKALRDLDKAARNTVKYVRSIPALLRDSFRDNMDIEFDDEVMKENQLSIIAGFPAH